MANGKADRSTLHAETWNEHDQIYSRTLNRMVEIGIPPLGANEKDEKYGGLVPPNPFSSQKQMAYMHANPEVLGPKALKEWDTASKGKALPKRVK